MTAKLSLRIAAIVMFLHDVGHIMGTLTWKKISDPVELDVIHRMYENKFPFMGTVKSIGEHYDGYALATALALLLIAIILWLVSGSIEQNNSLSRKIIFILSATLLFWGIDELFFFFPFAAAFSLVACALCIYSLSKLKITSAKM